MFTFECFPIFYLYLFMFFSLCLRVKSEGGPWVDVLLKESLIQINRFLLYSKDVCMTTSELFLYLLITIS